MFPARAGMNRFAGCKRKIPPYPPFLKGGKIKSHFEDGGKIKSHFEDGGRFKTFFEKEGKVKIIIINDGPAASAGTKNVPLYERGI